MPHTNQRCISRSRMPLNARLPLSKAIRNELRMCVTLRGYSLIREDSSKTLKQR